MNFRLIKTALALALGGTVLTGAGGVPARADDTVVICKATLADPPAAAGCAAVAVLAHELFLTDRPFGPNGELMKVLLAPVTIVDGNIKAAARESGELAKVLRATTGISVRDIEKYGIFGGPNSVFRKPFG
jgi:hypothetical protein